MNAKQRDTERLTDFIDLYEQLTEWQQLRLNVKMFGYLVGHFARDYKGRNPAENAAVLQNLGQFFTIAIWSIIWRPALLLTLAAIAGVLWGITMYRLGL